MVTYPWYFSILSCPDCKSTLEIVSPNELRCDTCSFSTAISTPTDLTPHAPNTVLFPFQKFAIPNPDEVLSSMNLAQPENIYQGPLPGTDPVPASLMSQIAASFLPSHTVLDLGCGSKNKLRCFEFLGCKRYVGLDRSGSDSDILGDAHFLPFQDHQFDVVFSYSVLEHLYNPYLALAEIRRVLKPTGIFVGTVSQGEPSHQSYFHHTAWALLAVCEATGFRITRLWSSWDTLKALAATSRYPKIIRILLSILSMLHENVPFLAPRRMMKWSEQDTCLNQLHETGAICFCMEPAEIQNKLEYRLPR